MKRILSFLLLLSLLHSKLLSQDLHFSQFYNTPLNLNPALTGVYGEDMRLMTNYRSQWASVPVPYNTISIGYDQKILNDGRLGNNSLGIGGFINYDRAGDAQMQLLQLGASGSYTLQISQFHYISVGTQLTVAQRRFNFAQLTFDRQFIDGTYLPNADTGEEFDNFSYTYLDLATGLNWLFKISKRMQFHFGIGVFHLTTPRASFFQNNESQLPTRWNLHLDAVIQLDKKLDLIPAAIYSRQGVEQERVFGTSLKYHLDQRFAREKGILAGFWYRMNDAAIASFGMHYPTWQATVSYDFTTSEFTNATNTAGGIEFSFFYLVTKVKPSQKRRICPIF